MSTQQDIYAAGSENRPPMLNNENYVPWSSRLLSYAKSKPNGKLLVNSIKNGSYVRRMIHEPGDTNNVPLVVESTHEQIDDELTEKEEIWLHVKQMMKGSSIGAQEKKAKLFNEWERFNSTEGESIESYDHSEVDDIRAERLARTHDPLNAVQNPGIQNVENQNGLIVVPGIANPNLNKNMNGNVVAAQAEGNGNGNNEAWIQLQAKEFDLMAAAGNIDEIEEVNANCILMENLQQASTSGIQIDKAPVYDSDGSAEVESCYDNDIFNMFNQEDVEHNGGTLEQHPATVEETHAYFESLYNNLVTEVEKVNTVNRKMKEMNADLTTELARYRGQEKSFEINKENFDELEIGYSKSVYQEQCLTKKINALHLSSAKQITTLNEEISNLNNQLSKEKSIVSLLQEEKKKLKSDFKIHEYEILDKQIQYEKKIKELDNILVKTGQSIQMMHMLSPNTDLLYQTEQKIALEFHKIIKDEIDPLVNQVDARVQNFKNHFMQEAAKFVRDFKSLVKEADKSIGKIMVLETEKERLLRAVASQDIMAIVQSPSVVETTDLQTEIEHTLDPSSQKLEDENVSLVFQVLNYAKENSHLKTIYKNLFDSINMTWAQTKIITDSLQDKLNDLIYENAKLRAQLFDKGSEQKDTTKGTSAHTKFANQSTSRTKLYSMTPLLKIQFLPKVVETIDLSKPVTSNSVPTTEESKVMKMIK
ncbi:hypothetical protein Tco_1556048 [Tanacetum coccineum]